MSAPDARTMPNFGALREAGDLSAPVATWLGHLEEWCETAVALIGTLDDEAKESKRALDDLERESSEQADAREELELLQDRILDIDRGIIGADELVLEVTRS